MTTLAPQIGCRSFPGGPRQRVGGGGGGSSEPPNPPPPTYGPAFPSYTRPKVQFKLITGLVFLMSVPVASQLSKIEKLHNGIQPKARSSGSTLTTDQVSHMLQDLDEQTVAAQSTVPRQRNGMETIRGLFSTKIHLKSKIPYLFE